MVFHITSKAVWRGGCGDEALPVLLVRKAGELGLRELNVQIPRDCLNWRSTEETMRWQSPLNSQGCPRPWGPCQETGWCRTCLGSCRGGRKHQPTSRLNCETKTELQLAQLGISQSSVQRQGKERCYQMVGAAQSSVCQYFQVASKINPNRKKPLHKPRAPSQKTHSRPLSLFCLTNYFTP